MAELDTLEVVEHLRVGLEIVGEDGFLLADHSDMGQISRPPADIVAQTLNAPVAIPLMVRNLSRRAMAAQPELRAVPALYKPVSDRL